MRITINLFQLKNFHYLETNLNFLSGTKLKNIYKSFPVKRIQEEYNQLTGLQQLNKGPEKSDLRFFPNKFTRNQFPSKTKWGIHTETSTVVFHLCGHHQSLQVPPA